MKAIYQTRDFEDIKHGDPSGYKVDDKVKVNGKLKVNGSGMEE